MSAAGITDARLVVKHTFLEFVDPTAPAGVKARWHTGSQALDAFCSPLLKCAPSKHPAYYSTPSLGLSDGPSLSEGVPSTPETTMLLGALSPASSPWTGYGQHPAIDHTGHACFESLPPAAFLTPWEQMPPEWMTGGLMEEMPYDLSAYGGWGESLLEAPWEFGMLEQHTPNGGEMGGLAMGSASIIDGLALDMEGGSHYGGNADFGLAEDGSCPSVGSGGDGPRTTVMMRNLPAGYTRSQLMDLIDSEGFGGKYNFLYLPIDFSVGSSLGYAFINLVTPCDAEALFRGFTGFSRWTTPSEAVCSVSWSEPHQGFLQHVERYRSSPVMHSTVADEWKPIILKDGVRVPFPPSAKKIRAPKVRSTRRGAGARTCA